MGRLKIYANGTERQRAHRQRAGKTRRRVELSLLSETVEQLRAMAGMHGLTPAQVVERLIDGLSFEQKDALLSEVEDGKA